MPIPTTLLSLPPTNHFSRSLNANLSENQEPETAAFVVPPFWVGADEKLLFPNLNQLKYL